MAKLRNRVLVAPGLAVTLLAVGLASPSAWAASDVCYSGGPTLANFKLNGNASLDGSSIVVTQDITNQSSSVMYQTPLSSTANFHIKMKVRITTPNNSAQAADGMTFIMHNAPLGASATGQLGEGLGYTGITPSVVVEFDTFRNINLNDPTGPHIAITRGGNSNHLSVNNATLPAPVLFSSLTPAVNPVAGTPFFIWIDYTVAGTRLDVFVSASDAKPITPALTTATINLNTVLGATFLIGFTSSTGGSWSKHELLELYATDTGATANAGCCTVDADCATSLAGGICDPQKHVCGTCTFTNVAGCPTGDKACNLNGSHNTCAVPCDGNFGAATAAACLSAAFPSCRLSGPSVGTCAACSGDFGTATTSPCATGAPFCGGTGYCGLCTANADCTTAGATHAGAFCNTTTGRCVGTCAANNDATCGPGNACLTNTCVARAPNSTAIPGGSCTAPLGARLCLSAVCSASNNTCGFVSGLGPCTTVTAATVCQSGLCSTGGVCIPAASGACFVDVDCTAGFFCERTTLTCKAKVANGAAIPNDGLHNGTCTAPNATATCASGLCNATTSTCGGANGTSCAAAGECQGNLCGSNSKCGAVNGQTGCTTQTAAAFCQSGTCNNGTCVPSGSGSCLTDAECGVAFFCKRDTFTCTPKLLSGEPLPNDGLHDGTCTNANAIATCASGLCNATSKTCGNPVGTACTLASTCANNICGSNNKCGNAPGAGPCSNATASQVCQSGVCGAQSALCIPGDAGGCGNDSDCAAASFCDGMMFHCTTDLPAGTALPADGVHNTCAAGNNAACVTGLCNNTTKTCGAPNGTACTDAKQCALNLCGSNGKCGLADGQPGCTVATANLCQGGTCSAAGVCGTLGCTKDSDCPATAFCNGKTGLCQGKLANGQSVPSDGIHDGSCTVPVGTAVCTSGACNVMTKQCALPVGGACTSAMACANGICSANGRCGRDVGEGPCEVATQAALCQSGVCNATSMQCQPKGMNGCTLDANCDSNSYCNRSTFTCEPKLDNGVSIPSDGVHDGTCENAPAVCASGLCNQKLEVCGAPNGDECTTATNCASNLCFDRQCGAVDGILCTSGTECRSNLCTDGVCGPGPAPFSVGGSGGCGIGSEGRSTMPGSLVGLTLLMLGLVARRRRRQGQ